MRRIHIPLLLLLVLYLVGHFRSGLRGAVFRAWRVLLRRRAIRREPITRPRRTWSVWT